MAGGRLGPPMVKITVCGDTVDEALELLSKLTVEKRRPISEAIEESRKLMQEGYEASERAFAKGRARRAAKAES